jgi:hypothetical protein
MFLCPNLAELATLAIIFVLIAIKIIVSTSTPLCSWRMPVYRAGCALQGVVRRDYLVLPSVNCTQYSKVSNISIIQAAQCHKPHDRHSLVGGRC